MLKRYALLNLIPLSNGQGPIEASKITASTQGENHPIRTLRQLLFCLSSGSDWIVWVQSPNER